MQEIIFGIALLAGLVALQAGMRYWTLHRTRVAWSAAQEHMTRGDFEEAEVALAKCVKLMPLWIQPRVLYGSVLSRLNKLESAEEQLKLAAQLQPKDAGGYIELAIFYITVADKMEDGIAALNQALKYDPQARYRIDTEPRLRDFREQDAYAQLEAE